MPRSVPPELQKRLAPVKSGLAVWAALRFAGSTLGAAALLAAACLFAGWGWGWEQAGYGAVGILILIPAGGAVCGYVWGASWEDAARAADARFSLEDACLTAISLAHSASASEPLARLQLKTTLDSLAGLRLADAVPRAWPIPRFASLAGFVLAGAASIAAAVWGISPLRSPEDLLATESPARIELDPEVARRAVLPTPSTEAVGKLIRQASPSAVEGGAGRSIGTADPAAPIISLAPDPEISRRYFLAREEARKKEAASP